MQHRRSRLSVGGDPALFPSQNNPRQQPERLRHDRLQGQLKRANAASLESLRPRR